MKFKETFYLACALLGIAAYYFWVEKPAEQEKAIQKEKESRVLAFEKDAVLKIELKRKDRAIVLEKNSSGSWDMLSPVHAKGDADAAASLLSKMESLKFTKAVSENPGDASDFGLKNPFLKVSLFLDNKIKKTINFGDDLPIGKGAYISVDDGPSVMMTESSRLSFDNSVYEMRDKSILKFDSEKVKKIKINRGGKQIELEKIDQDWFMLQQEKLKADSSAVQNFINNVRYQRAKQFIYNADEAPSEKEWEAPYLSIAMELEGEREHAVLTVASQKEGVGRFVRTRSSDEVFILGFSDLADITLDSVNLLDRTLLTAPVVSISEIELQNGESSILLQRSQGEESVWKIQRPIQSAVDSITINSFLADLREARIAKFERTTLEDPKLFGLDHPVKRLKIRSGEEVWSLELGNRSLDKKQYFGRRSGQSSVFSLNAALVEKLFRDLHSLRDKKILNFNTDSVQKIQWKFSNKTFELVKTGNHWKLEKPEKIENIKSFLGNEVLWTLKTIEFDSILDSPAKSEISWLASPEMTIEIWDEKGESLAVLKMGGKGSDGRVFAKLEKDARMYLVARRFLEEIPRRAINFK